ncbi:MAG: hypothetical protein LBT11_00705, partial [Treponema sp.]|nr:hypothetical protein [Treponema sp.]
MVCIICKKTEEELRIDNSQEIADIDKVISIIDDKIKEIMLGQISEQEKIGEKTFNNCMGETGKYCQNCTYVEHVDDVEYFWCKMHKKTFSLSVNSIIKQLKN